MSFVEVIVKNKKTGTWSMSSLIPHREDIIPGWSQLLTPLFSRGAKRPWWKEGNSACKYFG